MQVGAAINDANPGYDETGNTERAFSVWRSILMNDVEGDTERLAYFSLAGKAIRLCAYDPE